jgi:hypothetical protein
LPPASPIDNRQIHPSILATAETAQRHLHTHCRRRSSSTTHTLFFFTLLTFIHTIATASVKPTPYHIYHSLAPSSLRIYYLSDIVSTSFLAIACYHTLILGAVSISSNSIPWTLNAPCFLGPFPPPRLAVCLCWRCLVALVLSSTMTRVLLHNSSRYVHTSPSMGTWMNVEKKFKAMGGRRVVHLELRC